MRHGKEGSRGCSRVKGLISVVPIGRNRRDLLVDWSNTFLDIPYPQALNDWDSGEDNTYLAWHVWYTYLRTQVCSQCLCTPRHAPATRCRKETKGGCERETRQRRKSEDEQSYAYSRWRGRCASDRHFHCSTVSIPVEVGRSRSPTSFVEGSLLPYPVFPAGQGNEGCEVRVNSLHYVQNSLTNLPAKNGSEVLH